MDESIKSKYKSIPKDNSGAIAAERFTYQRYWAIRKAYNLYNSGEEFYVVFEGAEDIDVLKNDGIHFYQVKTNSTASHYSLTTMVRKDKNTGKSIISKLSEKEQYSDVVSLNLVSNLKLEDKYRIKDCLYNEYDICFSDLNNDFNSKIRQHVFDITNNTPNLSKYHFCYSDLSLSNARETMIGLTLSFLKNIKTTNERIDTFFDVIDIDTKSKMEKTIYTDILNEKAIGKEYFDELLKQYNSTSNDIARECQEIIKEYDVFTERKLQSCLLTMIDESFGSIIIKNNCKIVADYINKNKSDIAGKNRKATCDYLKNKIELDGEISEEDKLCYIIVGVIKYINEEDKTNE